MKYLKLFESFLGSGKIVVDLEKKHNLPEGTLQHKWIFPSNIQEDEVWYACDSIMTNPTPDNKKNYELLKMLYDNLNYDIFPYKGVEELPENIKFDILCGMSCRYNFDDIVWFSIDKKSFSHPDSKSVRDSLKSEFGIDIDMNWNEIKPGIKKMIPAAGWVASGATLNKLRDNLP
jgi:hypothetical protein